MTMAEDGIPTAWSASFWCIFFGLGIIGTLAVYGVLQERIMQIPYGGEFFTVSTFLVLSNRVCNFIFASVMVCVNGESILNQAPIWKYAVISFSNVAASTCQYEALKYVSFPVQMLGKSFKMMPVMLWGIAISGKQYTFSDWLVAACVTGGITEFLISGPTSSPQDSNNSIKGLFLLVCFLALDGLTSTMQEKLFKEQKTSKYNQIFYVNLCSACTSLIALLCDGGLFTAIDFCMAHPSFVGDNMILGASTATSQYFIYAQVQHFGALVFAATMNVRQVVSIALSYLEYGHYMTLMQFLSLVVVFSAIFYKSYAGLSASASKGESTPLLTESKDGDRTGQTADNDKPSEGKA